MSGFKDNFNFHMRIMYGLFVIVMLALLIQGESIQNKSNICDDRYYEMQNEMEFMLSAQNDLVNRIMPSAFKGRK